jgi:hypothetical protein
LKRTLRPLLLFALAAAYFSAGATLSLEWSDEGQIVYPSWRVAEGAIPYRDFGHLYGPSLFFLNGALLRLFGADLLVLRASLVVLKSITAVLVYACAARVSTAPLPLLAYGLLVAVWGGPWWVFNTPYANHYAATCILAGLLIFLALRPRLWMASFAAGICFGVAATFKQTSGAFAAAALALFLLRESIRFGAERDGDLPGWLPVLAVRAARIAVLAGVALLAAAYLAPQSTLRNALVLATPTAVLLGLLLYTESRGSIGAASLRALGAIAACGLGTALPLAAYAAFYASRGVLADLFFHMARGLPQVFDWFRPYPPPTREALALALALVGVLAASGWWAGRGFRRRLLVAAATLALVLPAALLLVGAVLASGSVAAYVGETRFYAPVLRFFFLLPLLVVCAGLPGFVRRLRDGSEPAADLFFCVAVLAVLFLYPAADFWHALMALPLFLPALAHELHPRVEGPARRAAVWPLAVGFLVLALPFVHGLWMTRATEPATHRSFARASGIASREPHFGEVLDLIAELDARAAPERRPLVLTNEQMIYFLAGRPSALEREEFVLYLVGAGLIRDRDARALIPEERMVESLRRVRPVVVDRKENAAAKRFRRTFPEAAAYITSSCPRVAASGDYDILDCR